MILAIMPFLSWLLTIPCVLPILADEIRFLVIAVKRDQEDDDVIAISIYF